MTFKALSAISREIKFIFGSTVEEILTMSWGKKKPGFCQLFLSHATVSRVVILYSPFLPLEKLSKHIYTPSQQIYQSSLFPLEKKRGERVEGRTESVRETRSPSSKSDFRKRKISFIFLRFLWQVGQIRNVCVSGSQSCFFTFEIY